MTELPSIEALEKLTLSLAVLDAAMSPEWDYRYFSFDRNWSVSGGERMASARNGQGDDYFLVFEMAGAFLKGFDHESPMSPWQRKPSAVWPGVLDKVPAIFAAQLAEPAFSMQDTTFCIWRRKDDLSWQRGDIEFPIGNDPDGSENLLWMLDGKPATYGEFCSDYYERNLDLATIESIYAHAPLTKELLAALNPEASWIDVAAECLAMGYPIDEADSRA